MKILNTIEALRSTREGLVGHVGLVPTMGALHEGHLSLVRMARAENDYVVVTIFVNPTQFGPNEDFNSYPRTLEHDIALLEQVGADFVFTPTPTMMYPDGFQTYVHVEQVTQGLEGGHRPGHFRGVTTVVLKLFNLVQPTVAYFGQKDAQQVVVIRRMVRDLNVPLKIQPVPTVREADGLALSSRNVYLSDEERSAATVLHRALQHAADLYERGERHPNVLRDAMLTLLASEPLAQVDYVSVAHPMTLNELTEPTDSPMLLSLTVQVGKPRLLDNMLLPRELNTMDGLYRVLGNE